MTLIPDDLTYLDYEPTEEPMDTVYAIVTFGSPRVRGPRWTRSLARARTAANEAKGTGTCTAVHVIACDGVSEALLADISDAGRIVYVA